MAIDPTGAGLRGFVEKAPDAPVVMLNLLRFNEDPDGGRPAYAAYSRAAAGHLARHGGEVLYAGDGDTPLVAEDGQDWDAVLVVRYPSRAAFGRMVADPDYQAITRLRSAALAEAVLQPTTPW